MLWVWFFFSRSEFPKLTVKSLKQNKLYGLEELFQLVWRWYVIGDVATPVRFDVAAVNSRSVILQTSPRFLQVNKLLLPESGLE